jgi:copper(I)-binding protein
VRARVLLLASGLLLGCPRAPPERPAVQDARVRLMPQGTGAVYFNVVAAADRLVEVRSPLCSWTELHETLHDGDVARMRHAPAGFAVTPREPLVLEPHGRHVMVRCTVPGTAEHLPITLLFEQAGEVRAEARLLRPDDP